MRIGIDMRMAGTGEGIARYCEELIKQLALIDHANDYFLLFQKRANSSPKADPPLAEKFKLVYVKSDYYSWAEQTKFVAELSRLKLDLVHFTSFNVPILYRGKFVVTIHDIIHHLFPGKKKARALHRLAYRLVFRSAVKRAQKIIAVSESTKRDIIKTFKVPASRIQITYEGVNSKFSKKVPPAKLLELKTKLGITKPYVLFVSAWRQYKNLPRLAESFDILKDRYEKDIQLVLAGRVDPFYPEIKKAVFAAKHADDILAVGYQEDEDLRALYQGASAFVIPSLFEGFGLTGIEAQEAGVPVAASNIPVLEEILDQGAIYFDPHDERDMAQKINFILSDRQLPDRLVEAGLENVKRFDWHKTARDTLSIYENTK